VRKFVSGYLTDKLTDLNENFGVAIGLGREPSLASTVGPIFTLNLGREILKKKLCYVRICFKITFLNARSNVCSMSTITVFQNSTSGRLYFFFHVRESC